MLAVGSRRTSPEVLEFVRTALEAAPVPAALLGGEGAENPYPGLLALADEIAVTADSAAMVSDAIAAGKPVGLVPVHAAGIAGAGLRLARAVRRAAEGGEPVNPLARIAGRFWDALVRRGVAGWPRDLWFFWREVERRGLAGTADRPARGACRHPLSPPRRRRGSGGCCRRRPIRRRRRRRPEPAAVAIRQRRRVGADVALPDRFGQFLPRHLARVEALGQQGEEERLLVRIRVRLVAVPRRPEAQHRPDQRGRDRPEGRARAG